MLWVSAGLVEFNFRPKTGDSLQKVTEGGDVLRITRTEQTIDTAEDAHQNTVKWQR